MTLIAMLYSLRYRNILHVCIYFLLDATSKIHCANMQLPQRCIYLRVVFNVDTLSLTARPQLNVQQLEERFVNNILNPVIFIKERDNYKNPTLPTSTRLVTMTILAEFSCQIILQKSLTVSCMGPTRERRDKFRSKPPPRSRNTHKTTRNKMQCFFMDSQTFPEGNSSSCQYILG